MGVKQEMNGKIGENLTEALLLDQFYVLKRKPDIEGADFLAQIQYDTLELIRRAKERIQVFGIIQSKYFEGNNEVKIAKEYVEDDESVRTEFFALLHTKDEDEKKVCYFFLASEIKLRRAKSIKVGI